VTVFQRYLSIVILSTLAAFVAVLITVIPSRRWAAEALSGVVHPILRRDAPGERPATARAGSQRERIGVAGVDV